MSARRTGAWLLGVIAIGVLLAPFLAPNDPQRPFRDRAYAPPTRVHVRDATGFRAPFIFDQTMIDRLGRVYADDPSRQAQLRWFRGGRLLSTDADAAPLLLLGADSLGRDVFSRLIDGAVRSLGVALAGALGALLIGALAGACAGTVGGRVDALCMTVADFVLVLPATYVVLVLRGMLPMELSTRQIFWTISGFFALAAWPTVARGVRAIVAGERARDYAEAARAAGASPVRIARHLLPAARGFLAAQLVLTIPALLLAEVTISFVGLGFGERAPSWGSMLQELLNVRVISEAPWMLAPAVAIFVVVLAVQLLAGARAPASVLDVLQRLQRRDGHVRDTRFDTSPA